MILFCSDIHGRRSAVEKLEKIIKEKKPTRIVILGDFLYNGPRNGVPNDYDPMYVCDVLNNYHDLIIGVRGNCDSRIDETLFKFKLADTRNVLIDGFNFNLIHGDMISERLINVKRKGVLAYGHTHIYNLDIKKKVVYFNPGSISFPKNSNPPTYGIVDKGIISIIDLNTDTVLKELDLNSAF